MYCCNRRMFAITSSVFFCIWLWYDVIVLSYFTVCNAVYGEVFQYFNVTIACGHHTYSFRNLNLHFSLRILDRETGVFRDVKSFCFFEFCVEVERCHGPCLSSPPLCVSLPQCFLCFMFCFILDLGGGRSWPHLCILFVGLLHPLSWCSVYCSLKISLASRFLSSVVAYLTKRSLAVMSQALLEEDPTSDLRQQLAV